MLNLDNYNLRNRGILLKNFFLKIRSIFISIKIFLLRRFPRIRLRANLVVFSLIALSFFYFSFFSSPNDFPIGAIVTIENGETLKQIAEELKDRNVIRSPLTFIVLTKIFISDGGIMAGGYFFDEKCSVICVVKRTALADYGIEPTRVTVIEGFNIYDIANLLKKKFVNFDSEEFLKLAQKEEGYLFPDTYYFLPSVTPQAVITTMKGNFYSKIEELSENLSDFKMDLNDVVIMASLLEKEARTLNSKRMIAGILWKRIEIGMPLQVDAVFPYIIGKNTYQVSLEDLKVDSPYNTYKNKGLPIGPIANPSLWSLLAATTPIKSDYLFYLSDRNGNMHYGVDFEQHKSNRYLYLN